ncbi:hypothetical protein RSAG8_09251, partial [Rhizoctonia solani AG-8 WAC10335]
MAGTPWMRLVFGSGRDFDFSTFGPVGCMNSLGFSADCIAFWVTWNLFFSATNTALAVSGSVVAI